MFDVCTNHRNNMLLIYTEVHVQRERTYEGFIQCIYCLELLMWGRQALVMGDVFSLVNRAENILIANNHLLMPNGVF